MAADDELPVGDALVGHALACRCGTRPWSILGSSSQPCRDWILFDIRRDPLELFLISHPMIVGLMLPERLAHSPQHQIRFPGRSPLDPAGDLGQSHLRQDQTGAHGWA